MLRCCAYLFQSGTITMERLIALYQHFRACLDTSYLCTVVCGGGGSHFTLSLSRVSRGSPHLSYSVTVLVLA